MLERVNYPQDLKTLNINELQQLAQDIREFLLYHVTQTGGHLSPNLGVVELTIAIHYVFNAPEDDILWDVGHQSYVHKILTGRKNLFPYLRKKDGLSGYPNPKESKYDVIHTGHSSTTLSIASGIATAKISKNDKSKTIVVIGDGAFTGGMVYEALNTISHNQLPVIIIINDNGMSICKNVGGISKYLEKLRLSKSYIKLKRQIENTFHNKIPIIGIPLLKFLYNFKESIKSIIFKKNFFEDLGIAYFGPIDGHNIKLIVDIFNEVKYYEKPIIIHLETKKGKGYEPSEKKPDIYHGIAGISVNGDGSIPIKKDNPSYSEYFGKFLCEFAEKDNNIVAITAAMKNGTGLKPFSEKYPDRFFDVGIAEEHAVDFALGLALKGKKPVVAIYSTFLQRSFDQLVNDIGISKSPLLFCLDRAGLVPEDGETHQGIFDISYLRMIPNFTIMMPATPIEFKIMMEYVFNNFNKPYAIRYPKDEGIELNEYNPENYAIKEGEGVLVTKGNDLILVSTGVLLRNALSARNILLKEKINIEIFNLRFAKPINNCIIEYLCNDNRPVLIIEEGIFNGGISEYLFNKIKEKNVNKKIDYITIYDEFPFIDTREGLLNYYNLSDNKIVEKIKKILE